MLAAFRQYGSRQCRKLVKIFACILLTSIPFAMFMGPNYSADYSTDLYLVPADKNADNLRANNSDVLSPARNAGHIHADEIRTGTKHETMEMRREQMLSACKNVNKEGARDYLENKVPEISNSSLFLHCPITKAASTFWSRFIYVLNTTMTPYSVSLEQSVHKRLVKFHMLTREEKQTFLQKATKQVFVRDPYSRMFSAYVDKAFAPNPYYWKVWGTAAISKFRKRAMAKSRRCGHDVTFAEVMSLAAFKSKQSKTRSWDLHFDPVFEYCQPCSFRYDVIGKMENFFDDLQYVSRRLNLSLSPYFASQQFKDDYVRDAIEDSVNSPFSWLSSIRPCMTKHEMGLRIWRKLQIRGIISRSIRLPFNQVEFEHVRAEDMIEAALQAHKKSTDRQQLKQQKRDAFIEAYSTVDTNTLSTMQKVFKRDFLLFGYDPRPKDVFESPRPASVGAFEWQKDWVG